MLGRRPQLVADAIARRAHYSSDAGARPLIGSGGALI